MNITLALAQLALVGLGWVGIAAAKPGDWPKHAIATLIALVFTWLASKLRPTAWIRMAPTLWVLTVIGLLVTMVLGRLSSGDGVARWIELGPFNLQFSEIAKIALILYLTSFFTRRGIGYKLVGPVLVIGLTSALVAFAPSITAGVFIFMLSLAVMFISGVGLFRIVSIVLFAAMLAVPTAQVVVKLFPYVEQRFDGYVSSLYDRSADPNGYGWQVNKTLDILERAGLVGLGPDVPMQPARLPARTTDFVIASVGHATGLLGVSMVIAMFGLILYQGFNIADHASELANRPGDAEKQTNLRTASVLAACGTLMLVSQAVINLGVAIGQLPNTGMTLPMVSFGGSSMIVCGVAFGWLHRAWFETRTWERRRERRKAPAGILSPAGD